MRVKTRLYIMAVLPVLLAAAVGLVLLRLAAGVDAVVLQMRAANSIVKDVFQLNTATYNYLQKPDAETQQRWLNVHSRLTVLATREYRAGGCDDPVMKDILNSIGGIKLCFMTLVDVRSRTTGNPAAVNIEAERELVRQLWVHAQTMGAGALTLAANGHDRSTALQKAAYLLISGTSVALAAMLVVFSILASRRINDGLRELQVATRKVAAGDLDHQIGLVGKDELGQLGEAFGDMMEELKRARESARTEIAAREKLSASLRDSNVQLSDALVRLRRAQEEVVQQERLKALRQISGGIVHDINDALMPILGLSDFLLKYPKATASTDDMRDCLSAIRKAAYRATTVVRHLSEYFYPTCAVAAKTVDLNRLILETIERVATDEDEGKRRIQIAETLGLIPVFASHEADLRQALASLILNAQESMPEGGTLTVRSCTDGAMAVAEISDTGVGMDPVTCQRCFEPFFSTKGYGFSGMGLTIARGAVARCRGTIEVASVPGQGSSFTIRLPMDAVVETSPVAPSAAVLPPKAMRVLLVDDEPWILKVLVRMLDIKGYHAEASESGRAALDMFKRNTYDLVIVDRAMPDMSGDEVAAQIKAMNSTVAIIMLTGFGDLMTERGEHPDGVDCILCKPVTIDELSDAIQRVLQTVGTQRM